MLTSLMIFHAVISIILIIMVLLQFGKGAEAGLMSGGGEVFTGSQQGNILTKVTVVLSVIFLANCIILAKMQSSENSKSLLDGEAPIAAPLTTGLVNKKATAAPKTEAKTPAKKTETKK